jgi:Mg2+-importing ATPase
MIFYSIRTVKPFWKSRPGTWLMIASALVVAIAFALLYSPINWLFELIPVQPIYLAVLAFALIAYFVIVELLKRWFFRKFEL